MDRVAARPNQHDHEDYQHPSLTCDLVMKGGITSGVTYPRAVMPPFMTRSQVSDGC